MLDDATRWSPDETGGMLVGYRTEHHGRLAIVITGLIDAGPKATRSTAQFVPDGRWQQQQLEDVYEGSGRITTYLGDWHSHPRGRARPSAKDLATFARVAAGPESGTHLPLALILALGRTVTIAAYGIDGHRDSVEFELSHVA
jgi:integrative and conjugative element protein (TIGR02256 family)